MQKLRMEVMAGVNLYSAVADACILSREIRKLVHFMFNGVYLFATPKKSPVTICWEYWHTLGLQSNSNAAHRRRREWEASRALDVDAKQRQLNEAVFNLSGTLACRNLDLVVGWIMHVASFNGDIDLDWDQAAGVNQGGMAWVVIQFEKHGFRRNMCTNLERHMYNQRFYAGTYLVGQVIDCLLREMPIHPVAVPRAKDYFELPDQPDVWPDTFDWPIQLREQIYGHEKPDETNIHQSPAVLEDLTTKSAETNI